MEINAITCSVCSKIYKNLITYNKHISLNRCHVKVLDNICKYCDNVFKTKQNKQKHELRCSGNKTGIIEAKMKIISKAISDIKNISGTDIDLYSNNQLQNIVSPPQNVVNQAVTNGNIVNNNNKIIINNFGSEDTSHITQRQLIKAFKMCKEFPLEMIKITHFDKDKPENHNIYKPNFKDKYVKYFNDSIWKIGDAKKIITEIYMSKMDIAEEKFDDLKPYLSEITQGRFQWFLDNREETEVMSEILKKIAEMLYNERSVIADTTK